MKEEKDRNAATEIAAGGRQQDYGADKAHDHILHGIVDAHGRHALHVDAGEHAQKVLADFPQPGHA